MKTTAICPISDRKVDEHVARLNGGFTVLFLLMFILSGSILPIFFLLIDFALRSGHYSRFSAFSFLSRNILKSLSIKPVLINAGPKIFSARIGLLFTIVISVSFLFASINTGYVFSGIFGTCAILESVFGYCVACQVYPFVYKLLYQHKIQKFKI